MARKSSAPVAEMESEEEAPRHAHKFGRKRKRFSFHEKYIKDTYYRPSGLKATTPPESDDDITAALKPKAPSTRPKSTVERPANLNSKDPFEYLGDDEVESIISLLPASDTETLRRVSRLWKASSEFHNSGAALRRHFGHFGEKADCYPTRESANLAFRRRLYHENSLKRGKATTAISCSGATFWHTCNHRLLWSSRQGHMHVRDLQHARSNGQMASFDLQSIIHPRVELLYARLTESGDIIAGTRLRVLDELPTSDNQTVVSTPSKYHLMRLSQNGSTIWRVKIARTGGPTYELCDTATTLNNRHYGFEPVMDTELVHADRIAFTVRSLEDGQIVMQRELPMATVQRTVSRDYSRLPLPPRLDIATDGTFLILGAYDRDVTLIINAADGDCFCCSHSTPETGLPAGGASSIWIIKYGQYEYVASRHFTFSSATKELRVSKSQIIVQRSHILRPGVDVDRSLVFRLIHSDACPGHEADTVDPWTTFAVIDMEEDTHYNGRPPGTMHAFIEQKKTKLVTLPLDQEQGNATVSDRRSKKKRKSKEPETDKRLLEFEAGWDHPRGDFIGMSNDYLIHHATHDQTLLVLDFWPQW